MPRYRQIDVEKRVDDKYRALSKPAPNAQSLFDYFLECGHDRSIPGLLVVGLGQICDELDWPREALLSAYAELDTAGMAKADWAARVVWLPGAIKRRATPRSRKNIKGWGQYWSEIPNCALKTEAHAAMKTFLESLPATEKLPDRGDVFASFFVEVCPTPRYHVPHIGIVACDANRDANRNQDRRNDKENDNDKEKDLPLSPPSGQAPPSAPKKRRPKKVAPDVDDATAHRAREVIAVWNETTAETRLPAQADFGELPTRDQNLVNRLKGKDHRTREWWRIIFADIAQDPKSFQTHGWRPMLHLIIESEEKLREQYAQAMANRRRVSTPEKKPTTPTAAERSFDAVRDLVEEAEARERGDALVEYDDAQTLLDESGGRDPPANGQLRLPDRVANYRRSGGYA